MPMLSKELARVDALSNILVRYVLRQFREWAIEISTEPIQMVCQCAVASLIDHFGQRYATDACRISKLF